jgi:stress response protein YsnF
MATSVYGLFESRSEAERVVQELESKGYPSNSISIMAANAEGETIESTSEGEERIEGAAKGATTGAVIGGVGGVLLGLTALAIPGVGPIVAAGPIAAGLTGAGIGAAAGGLIGALTKAGVPEEDAQIYAEGIRRGGALVSVTVDDSRADDVADLMESMGAVDIDERGAHFRNTGYTGYSATARPFTREEITRDRETLRNLKPNEKLEVVQEDIRVGKRAVDRGGVRVRTYVTERPVEEQVKLREERVEVQRTPVDRPASPQDLEAFKEGTVEVREMAEEAVVAKEARVVEEVSVGKTAEERTETVRDKVRETHVDVEQLAGTGKTTTNWTEVEPEFRQYWQQNMGTSGGTWETYAPAYQYGYTTASQGTYGTDWNQAEQRLRQDWEARNPGTWDRYRDSIQYAWQRQAARRSGGAELI